MCRKPAGRRIFGVLNCEMAFWEWRVRGVFRCAEKLRRVDRKRNDCCNIAGVWVFETSPGVNNVYDA